MQVQVDSVIGSLTQLQIVDGTVSPGSTVESLNSCSSIQTAERVMRRFEERLETFIAAHSLEGRDKVAFYDAIVTLVMDHIELLAGEEVLVIFLAVSSIVSKESAPIIEALCHLATRFFQTPSRSLYDSLFSGSLQWLEQLKREFEQERDSFELLQKCLEVSRTIIAKRRQEGLFSVCESNPTQKVSSSHPLHFQKVTRTNFHNWYALCYWIDAVTCFAIKKDIEENVLFWVNSYDNTPQELHQAVSACALVYVFLSKGGKTFSKWCNRHPEIDTFHAWSRSKRVQAFMRLLLKKVPASPKILPLLQASVLMKKQNSDDWVLQLNDRQGVFLQMGISEFSTDEILSFFPKVLLQTSFTPSRLVQIAKACFKVLSQYNASIALRFVSEDVFERLLTLPWLDNQGASVQEIVTFEQVNILSILSKGVYKQEEVFERALKTCVARAKIELQAIKEHEYCFDSRLASLKAFQSNQLSCIEQLISLTGNNTQIVKMLPTSLFYDVLWSSKFSLTILSSPRSSSGDVRLQLLQAVDFLKTIDRDHDSVYADCIKAFVDEIIGICKEVQGKVVEQEVYHPRMLIKNSLMRVVGQLYGNIQSISVKGSCLSYIDKLTSDTLQRITSYGTEITAVKSKEMIMFVDRECTYCRIN